MKKCTYCGKEYPDDVLICPNDAWPLVDPNAPAAPPPPVMQPQSQLNYGFVLMLAAVIATIVFFVSVFQEAEASVGNQNPDRNYMLLRTTRSPGDYSSSKYEIIMSGDNGFSVVNDIVVRFSDGAIWEAKAGEARILWGNPFLVAKAHALMVILFLLIFFIGVLMWNRAFEPVAGSGGKNYELTPSGRKRFLKATIFDMVISAVLPLWGVIVGLIALSKGEKNRALTMLTIGVAMTLILILASS
jgi:hypothetical protein